MREKTLSLPLFVPHVGCPCRCSFCDQKAISGTVAPVTAQEVTAALEALPVGAPAYQLSFFGGSFTALPQRQMRELLEAAQPFLKSGQIFGIRLSTRPDAIDAPLLDYLKQMGVYAIELGAQSMDDAVLARNGRGHTAAQVQAAAGLIKAKGFVLGLQMMTGLPGDTPEGAWQTAQAFLALAPQEVRIYPTVVLQGTMLAQWMQEGRYTPPTVEETIPLVAGLLAAFRTAGVRVLRLGLHPSREVENALLGGCYHPAFGERCEGYLFYQSLQALLLGVPKGQVMVAVHPKDYSKVRGHKGENLARLAAQGYFLQLVQEPALPQGQVQLAHQ